MAHWFYGSLVLWPIVIHSIDPVVHWSISISVLHPIGQWLNGPTSDQSFVPIIIWLSGLETFWSPNLNPFKYLTLFIVRVDGKASL